MKINGDTEELKTIHDVRASFYGKASVYTRKNDKELVKELKSYDTLVATYILDFETMKETFIYLGKYSQTTTRHQKEFFRQLNVTEKELKELFKNGKLEREVI